MSIIITPATGSAVTLAHGPSRTLGNAMGPDNYSLRCAPGVRRREYIGDAGPRYEPTGLDEVSGSFSVVLRCSDKSAATIAALAIIASTPRTGTLSDGSVTLYDAALTDITVTQKGAAVFATYSFSGCLTQASI